MTSLGAATADMMRFNTKDSQVHVHVDQVIDNDKNLVLGSGYLFNNNPQTGRTTLRHDTTDHYFMMHADSSITELEIAGKGVTIIGYDVNNAMYSGMGASTGNGLITLDGNVVPGVGRGMGMYNAGFRRDLGSTSLRFGTVYVDSVDRGHYIDSGTYGSATAMPVFTVNKTGLIDSIGTVPTAGIDSASWLSQRLHPSQVGSAITGSNTFRIATHDGTLHDVLIKDFADSVKFDGDVIFSHQPNNKVLIPYNTKLEFGDPNRAIASHLGYIYRAGSGQNDMLEIYNSKIKLNGWLDGIEIDGKVSFDDSATFNGKADFLDSVGMTSVSMTSLVVDNVKIDGNTISSTDNSNQLFIDPAPVDSEGGDLIVRGNLVVRGVETIVNSTTMSVNDKNIVLADSAPNSSSADGAGLTVGGALYSGTKPQFIFDAATDRWDPNLPLDIPFASLDSAMFLNGVALREVVEDHMNTFFAVDSNAALTLTYNDVQNSMTWKAINATKSQVGVSSFDSASFTVTAGHVAVTVLDGGTY